MKSLSLSFVSASALLACASYEVAPQASKAPAPGDNLPVSVATPDVTITLDNGTVLNAEPVVAPFAGWCKHTPLAPDDYRIALTKSHAQRVRVKVPSLETPLYAVLAICRIHNGASGPGSRAHRIQIPNEYVDATDGGRVSVVYEETDGIKKENGSFTSWQLFLSRAPFPSVQGEPAAAPAPVAPAGTPIAPAGSAVDGGSGAITR